jgi:pimeloyl-ACP methyl ester carboxylesterase
MLSGPIERPYERRIIAGVGHNLPQEAPDEFVEAILALQSLSKIM